MKFILSLVLLVSSLSFGASTTAVPIDAGLKQVYITDQNGNGLFDSVNGPVASVSLGSTLGKAVVGSGTTLGTLTGNYAEVLTYTTTVGKNFYITGYEIDSKLNTPSATVSNLGYCSLQIPRGTTIAKFNFTNASHGAIDRVFFSPAEPIGVQSANTTVISCIPAGATSTIWGANIIGYEK